MKSFEQTRAPCPHALRTFLEKVEPKWSQAPTLNGEVGALPGHIVQNHKNYDFERQKQRRKNEIDFSKTFFSLARRVDNPMFQLTGFNF